MYLIDKGTDERLDRNYYKSSFAQRLEMGELWEYLVLLELKKLNLSAYRPEQRFKKRGHYTQLQRDVLVKINRVRRLTLEIKSRNDPFKYPSVLIGDCKGFDAKLFKVDAIVVVDQRTGNCQVAPGDPCEFIRVRSKALSYAVPINKFTPLDCWADSVLAGLYD